MKFAISQLAKILNVSEDKISTPPDPKMGDYSTSIAFEVAKRDNENPAMAAIKIISTINIKDSIFEHVKAQGPYINFFLNKKKFAELIIKNVLKDKDKYGFLSKNGKKIIIEFPSPNTNKPLHIGHARNMSLGESVSRLLESQGFIVKRLNLFNDRGVHICKSMLAYQKWGKGKKPNDKSDHFVGDFYVMFSKKAEENKKLEDEAQKMLKDWEDGNKKVRALWKKMNAWFFKGFEESIKRFGLKKFDKVYYESDFYDKAKKIVYEGVDKGVFKKDNTGAVFVDLGNDQKKCLLRGDGTSLYITQDLYLAKIKYDEFKFDRSLYVIANEQSYQMSMLFKTLKLLGYSYADNCHHLSYGMVMLPEGKMSSRKGNFIGTDELMDELHDLAMEEMKKREKEANKKIADLIGLSALKYYMLKVSNNKDIVFNPAESISFDGDTGPYLLYSLVRANKILSKVRNKILFKANPGFFESEEIFNIVKLFAEFPDVVEKSANEYSPYMLCNYAFKLASTFNAFYEKNPVLTAENEDIKKSRALIVHSFAMIMESCLKLLNIESVKSM
ncbi:Arginine--tRNA ligase [Candidatus Tiddalikarchaeum anstoanum]|nr:Arginine--tRNA ligase [Candidatus Tiddalikarchaeum anstoanum]